MNSFFQDIPAAKNWQTIKPIHKGWSKDQKYYIENNKGCQFLLRISEKSDLENQREEYDALLELNKKHLRVSKLISSGKCNNNQNTYRLFEWIAGVEIKEVLNSFSEAQQYQYGKDAGKILRQIHTITGPKSLPKWENHYQQKIQKKISLYQQCGIQLQHADKIISYIKKQLHLINKRPQSFHHGDYHLGNMLIQPNNQLAIIDFNRLDFGDPWEEFNRITWTASASPAFASGQINGYFDKHPPSSFFKLMGLYIGTNQLGAIPWAIPYGQKEITTIVAQTEEVLAWYDNFNQFIPSWYHAEED